MFFPQYLNLSNVIDIKKVIFSNNIDNAIQEYEWILDILVKFGP